jgi:hypothetical protein
MHHWRVGLRVQTQCFVSALDCVVGLASNCITLHLLASRRITRAPVRGT